MSTLWILVADAAVARILNRPASGTDLEDVEQLTDAAAHARRADLRRDAYGRRAGDDLRMGGNATSSAGEDEQHLEAEGFARRVAERLDQAHRQGRFDALQVVAEPRFLGLLRKALTPQVAAAVVGEVDKDLVHDDRRALTRRLFPD
jgi:protein required for attachment to host cells